jgi:mono/diheme cytochrome c family protein
MVRETRAKWLALATALLVVLMVAGFAALRNMTPPASAQPAAEATPPALDAAQLATIERGRQAFERLACAACHAVAGQGNPASPLDGVGKRLDRDALRDWSAGTGVAREQLAPGLARAKARAAQDPDLDALVEFLAQLR